VNLALIIGCAVGGVALLGIGGVFLYFLVKKLKKPDPKKGEKYEETEKLNKKKKKSDSKKKKDDEYDDEDDDEEEDVETPPAKKINAKTRISQ
jgi:H+/gluconate symporter-like permease